MKCTHYTANLSSTPEAPEDWRAQAKCRTLPEPVLERMFWPKGKVGGDTLKDAKAFCRGLDGQAPCPVQPQCLAWALTLKGTETEYGCHGGYSGRDLRKMRGSAARNLVPADPLREALRALVPSRFATFTEVDAYVSNRAPIGTKCVTGLIYDPRPTVGDAWARHLCGALDLNYEALCGDEAAA